MDCGASIEWCTQFPGQGEILFAPLTGMQVVGEPRVDVDGGAVVLQIRLNSNLHDSTIEQVVAKMRGAHLNMVRIIETDLQQLNFPVEALDMVSEHRRRMGWRDGQWFNQSENFALATEQALKMKSEACGTVLLARRIATATPEQVALALDEVDTASRIAACKALARLGGQGGAVHVPTVANSLQHAFKGVRAAACKALAGMGTAGHAHTGEVAGLLQDKFFEVREAACNALAEMDTAGHVYAGGVAELLQNKDFHLRKEACNVLANMGTAGEAHAGAVAKVLPKDSAIKAQRQPRFQLD